MRLEHVEIVNFRSIEYAKIEFDPRCRILVGMNDTGKSNVLKALATLGDENLGKKSDRRQGINDDDKDFYVRARFSPDAKDWEELETVLKNSLYNSDEIVKKIIAVIKNLKICSMLESRLNDSNRTRYFFHEKEIESTINDIEFDNGWMQVNKNINLDSLSYAIREQVNVFLSHNFVHQEDIEGIVNITDDILKKVFKSTSDAEIKEVINKKIKQWYKKEFKFVFWQADDPKHLVKDEVLFSEFITQPSNFLFLNNMFKLNEHAEYSGDNERDEYNRKKITDDKIVQIINDNKSISTTNFQNYLAKVAANFSKYFKKIWGNYNYDTQDINLDNFEFDLSFTDEKLCFNVAEKTDKVRTLYPILFRGTGLKKFIEFLLAVSNKIDYNDISDTLFIIDEPETSLHPSAAHDFRDILLEISSKNNNYVLFATHSVSMMERDNLPRHYIVRRENGVTSVESAEKISISQNKIQNVLEYEFLYNEVGYSTYENFKEKNIIFEGWTDKKLFLTYFRGKNNGKNQSIDFGITHVGGIDTMRNISPILELSRRLFLIISDSDNSALQSRKNYIKTRGYGKWCLYNEINDNINATTAEDFLKTDFIVKQIKSYLIENASDFKNSDISFTENDLSYNANERFHRCKKIKQWLDKNLKKEIKTSNVMRKIKNQIFMKLEYNNIIDEYEMLYNGITELQKKLNHKESNPL